MDKYLKLKDQVLGELKWTIDSVNKKYPEKQIPQDIRLVDFIGQDYSYINHEDRGQIFAYLSIKSKIDYLDSEEYEYEEDEEP